MSKIPVGKTIAHAYRFAFGEFPQILGVIWLPFVLVSVAGFLVIQQMAAVMTAVTTQNLTGIGGHFLVIGPVYVVMFVFFAMQIVAVTRLGLGQQEKPAYFFFSLGKPVWRLIGAYLLVALIFIGVEIVLGIGLAIISAIAGAVVGATAGANDEAITRTFLLIGFLIFAIIFAVMMYVFTRLTFLLPSVVVAERRTGLGRAWSLGRGNFWRMFAILLAVMLPLLVIEFLAFAFWSPDLLTMVKPGATPAEILAWDRRLMEQIVHYLEAYWFIALPVWLAVTTVYFGLLYGARAFAYRALVPAEGPETYF